MSDSAIYAVLFGFAYLLYLQLTHKLALKAHKDMRREATRIVEKYPDHIGMIEFFNNLSIASKKRFDILDLFLFQWKMIFKRTFFKKEKQKLGELFTDEQRKEIGIFFFKHYFAIQLRLNPIVTLSVILVQVAILAIFVFAPLLLVLFSIIYVSVVKSGIENLVSIYKKTIGPASWYEVLTLGRIDTMEKA